MFLWTIALLGILFLWIAFWFLRVRAWTRSGTECSDAPVREDTPSRRVSVIIPARNEAQRIALLVTSLASEGPKDMEIIVVDDDSTDDTAARVRKLAAQDSRIRLLVSAAKPESWSGKPWALAQGADVAAGNWLMFCDADVILSHGVLEKAFRLIAAERLDCLAVIPRMRSRSLPVELLLSCFTMSRTLLFRPVTPGKRGLLQGACMLIRKAAHDQVKGFGSVRDSLLEDVDFGHVLSDAGFRVRMLTAHDWAETEMYADVKEAVDGFQRITFAVLGFSMRNVVFALFLYVALFLIPFVSLPALLFLTGVGPASAGALPTLCVAAAAFAAMYAVAWHVIRRERMSVIAAVLLPLSYLAFLTVVLQSVVGYRRGGIRWKGRLYRSNALEGRRGRGRLHMTDVSAGRGTEVDRRPSWLYS